jgi:hypothetical protein
VLVEAYQAVEAKRMAAYDAERAVESAGADKVLEEA